MFFEFFLREAWTSLRRSGLMTVVSLVTITVSLVIFGAFLLAVFNFGAIMSSLGTKLEIVAYVDANIDQYAADNFIAQMTSIEGVAQVKYVTKETAWENFKSDFEGRLQIGDTIKENPLPNTFIIKVKSPDMVNAVAKKLSNIQSIDEVRYSGRLAERFQSLYNAVRLGGIVLVGLLIIATLLIVVNTIRLTVIARKTDIAIMKLVGATDAFIKWPFIIEGLMIGVIGSAVSFIILKFSYDVVASQLITALPFLTLISSKSELIMIFSSVAALGIVLGMLGGYISVNSSLKETV